MRITTALTKYESAVCMDYHDFGRYRRMLDVGGNSGEFALWICRGYPAIRATVFDLPLVCDIGRQHVASEPEANRIEFIRGDALTDVLPCGFDLVVFKSMLHDWPEETARQLIAKAGESLDAGGTLLIYERGPIELGESSMPYSMIPFLLFFRSLRSPRLYEEQLLDLGFEDVVVRRIPLEMPFYLVTAKKGK
jgi:SAM-dependent methyltransferase